MVGEFCMDLANTAGGLEVETLRCVQCGEVVHPVILQNRKHQQKTITEKASKMSGHSVDGQAVT